jgi:hypothetical protein
MDTFKRWLRAKRQPKELKEYLAHGCQALMSKDHARIQMIKQKVLQSHTPDEFTALRDFAPYIIWTLQDCATRIQRAKTKATTNERC